MCRWSCTGRNEWFACCGAYGCSILGAGHPSRELALADAQEHSDARRSGRLGEGFPMKAHPLEAATADEAVPLTEGAVVADEPEHRQDPGARRPVLHSRGRAGHLRDAPSRQHTRDGRSDPGATRLAEQNLPGHRKRLREQWSLLDVDTYEGDVGPVDATSDQAPGVHVPRSPARWVQRRCAARAGRSRCRHASGSH